MQAKVVNLYSELRFLTWAGVMLIAAGVSVLISKHLDRIGPVAIALAIGAASAGCYGYAYWRRRSGGHHLADDYVLLLAALLASADLAYIEAQFHPLGERWQLHFLIAAALHAAVAYAFDSRLVLSLAIAAVAAYIGIERGSLDDLFRSPTSFASRALLAAGVIAAWRLVQRRRDFDRVFEHAVAHLAFWASLGFLFDDDTRFLGFLLALVLAGVSGWYGWRRRTMSFIAYAVVYGTIAADIQMAGWIDDVTAILLFVLLSSAAAIAGLFVIHARMRREVAA